jgi:glutamate synthase domain-containing protein 3
LSLAGNAVGYGATGGKILVEGRVGQRVGVRNSGAHIVVEGAGKYAFEYMTGGIGVVLGPVGPVVGSGLTGGVLYLLDDDRLEDKIHKDAKITDIEPADVENIHALLSLHLQATESVAAQLLLNDKHLAKRFRKVIPA